MTEVRTIDVVRERMADAARKVGFDVGTPTRSNVRPGAEAHGLFHRGQWVGTYELRPEIDQTDDAPVVVAHLFLPQAKDAEPREIYSDGTPVRTNNMRIDMPGTIDRAVIRMTVGFDAMAKGYDLEPAVAVETLDREMVASLALLLNGFVFESSTNADMGMIDRVHALLAGTSLLDPDTAEDLSHAIELLRSSVAEDALEPPSPF